MDGILVPSFSRVHVTFEDPSACPSYDSKIGCDVLTVVVSGWSGEAKKTLVIHHPRPDWRGLQTRFLLTCKNTHRRVFPGTNTLHKERDGGV